jgi:hypothetical protein
MPVHPTQNDQPIGLGADFYTPRPLPTPLGGQNSSLHADQIEDHQLSSASNLVPRDGLVEQRKGYETLIGTALSSTPLTGIEFIPFDQSSRIVLGHRTGFVLYNTSNGGWDDITTSSSALTGTVNDPIVFTPVRTTTAGIALVATNNVDVPKMWSGATSATFTKMYDNTSLTKAGTVTQWRSHLVYGDVTNTASTRIAARMQWAALGNPTALTGTASTGTLDLLDSNATKINQFVPLRGSLLAYKEEGCHTILYRAAPLYFTQSLLHASLTTISRRAVVSVLNGDRHVVVTKENIILWDGQNIRTIGTPIQREFYGDLNWDAAATVWTAYNALEREVLIGMPSGSATVPDRVYIYSLDHGSWWPTDLDWYGALQVNNIWSPPRLLTWRADAKVYQAFSGLGDTTAGTAISSSGRTKRYDFAMGAGLEQRVSVITGIFGTGTAATSTIKIQRAASDNALAAGTLDTATDITATGGIKEHRVATQITGKHIEFKVTHTAADETMQWRGLIPYVGSRSQKRRTR